MNNQELLINGKSPTQQRTKYALIRSTIWSLIILAAFCTASCSKDNETDIIADSTAMVQKITLSSSPVAGGVTAITGAPSKGAEVVATATVRTGYTFTSWTINGAVVSTSPSYPFIVTADANLVANFTLIPDGKLAVNISSNPVIGGTTSGSGSYTPGTEVTLTATPNAGYIFTGWSGAVTATTNPLKFVILANRTLVANFTAVKVVVNLGTAGNYQILAKTGISTTGVTSITGDIAVSPAAATAITGFGLTLDASNQFALAPVVIGKIYAADYTAPTPAKMTTAVSDMENAFTTANGLSTPAPVVEIYAGDISGKTLTAGVYKWGTGVLVSAAGLTLNGGPNDTWVFQIAQNLTISNSAKITLTGGAQAKNIFWVVSGAATLGTNADFSGIILGKTLISLNTGAKVTGKLLAQTAVTLNASTIVEAK